MATTMAMPARAAEFNFPFLPEAQKKEAEATAASCERVELTPEQKSTCFATALEGYATNANNYFEKAMKNLPSDVRDEAWGRCKAVASNKNFDYLEGALACQNVVAYIYRERIAAKEEVTTADLKGSTLLLTYAMRVAQLSILAHHCFEATKGCATERALALGRLPDIDELGETSLFLYDPDKPKVLKIEPTNKRKPTKPNVTEVKKVVKEVDEGQKAVHTNPVDHPCPPAGQPAPTGWTFDPFQHPSGASGSGGGTGIIDLTKPFFPPGFDFGIKSEGGADKGPAVIDHTRNPRDPAGLGAALDASDRLSGVAPARLPGAVSAVREAAGTAGPDRGSAVFVLSTDSSGHVVNVSVQGGGANTKEWEELIPAIKASMSNTRARMKNGAAGMSVSIAVEAEHRNPSGTLEGHKIGGPKVENASLVVMTFDLSDIGSRATRQIRVRQLGEQTLY